MIRSTTPIEKEVFECLNELRESGITNMFGATPYIEKMYPQLTKREARDLLQLWMKCFDQDGNYGEIDV